MKKLFRMFWSVATVAAFFVAVGCGSNGDSSASGQDSLTIDSVSPSSVISGATTTFTVSVSYNLQTKDNGLINFGFGTSTSYALEPEQKIVTKGTGTVSFVVSKTVTGFDRVHVILSEYPHPPSWSPLDTATQIITIN